MTYRYLPNLRSDNALRADRLDNLIKTRPAFTSKPEYRAWCANQNTNHVFYSLVEGSTPSKRVSHDNPPHKVFGVVADYDAPVDWANIEAEIQAKCKSNMPTWITKTFSGYMRLVWEFANPILVAPEMFDRFMRHVNGALNMERLAAGFDGTSLKATQYFELGTDWKQIGGPVDDSLVLAAVSKAASDAAPTTSDTHIPIDVIAAEVEARWPGRWPGTFEVGARGPLFWIDDGIDRIGCQVAESGIVCYSDRANSSFVSWRELLGKAFVSQFEQQKLGSILDEYWHNGKMFYKFLHGTATVIPKEQLILELRKMGFDPKIKKGQRLSELEEALLTISNQNRIDEIAPVVFSDKRVVDVNSHRILNCARLEPVRPASTGDPAYWPFINYWLNQLFVNGKSRPTVEYFYAWMQRFYAAVLKKELRQGQALVLVGPTGRGKSLLSNKVISGLVGGYADASDYISGQTKFNKDLGRVAAWVIDDTTSAASFQDQRKATELIKRTVANPRIEYQAKFADTVSIPWAGRVILSLNMDPNSLSVIPSLDSSNRDKLMALRIDDNSMTDFPANDILENRIATELPFFGKWLLDWQPPDEVRAGGRFGVKSYIDDSIASAAYDNSSRSSVAELVEFFAKKCREITPNEDHWEGTLTEFLCTLHDLNGGRTVGVSGNMELVRRGMLIMEEGHNNNPALRPVVSSGRGGGKVWRICLSDKYDIERLPDLTL